MVGAFHADFYQINGMVLESRKRREHLSEEDLQKNKAIMESLTKGSSQGFKNGEVRFLLRNIYYYCCFKISVFCSYIKLRSKKLYKYFLAICIK